jgi:TPR repeat protein
MKSFLEKLSQYWQLRFVAVAVGVLLIVYAVLLPDAGSDSSDSSIGTVSAAPLIQASAKSGTASAESLIVNDPTLGTPAVLSSESRSAEVPTSWLGVDRAVADQLEIPVQAAEGSELPVDFSESIRRLQGAANRGNSTAQFLLGHAYEAGLGVAKNIDESTRWYAKAAEEHTADATGAPAMLPVKDFSHALDNYRAAAEQGDVGAQLYLGLAYDTGHDVPRNPMEAAHWYRRAAVGGSASAASNLGVLYHNGDGMAKDSVEASKWFQAAASRGSASGQYSLGRMYYEGDGVAMNYAESAQWLEKSASQGNASAQILLSYLYATGQGVHGSTPQAYMWINLASANESLARLAREQVEKIAPYNEIAAGQRLTHEWLTHHPQSM